MSQSLYLLSPPKILSVDSFCEDLNDLFSRQKIRFFQIRLKEESKEKHIQAMEKIFPICQRHDVYMIMNDHVNLAKKYPCHGVHIGKDDMPFQQARQKLGKNKIIGVSCYNSLERAREMSAQGADYVAFGSFFQSPTKQTGNQAHTDLLQQWQKEKNKTPSVAIGGITTQNYLALLKEGANFIAMCSGIWHHPKSPLCAIDEYIS